MRHTPSTEKISRCCEGIEKSIMPDYPHQFAGHSGRFRRVKTPRDVPWSEEYAWRFDSNSGQLTALDAIKTSGRPTFTIVYDPTGTYYASAKPQTLPAARKHNCPNCTCTD